MREMNSGVAEDIVNGETAMVGTRQEMGIIGFRGDATTAQPRDVLAADTPACRHPAAATLIGRVGPGPRSYWSAPRSAGGAARAGRRCGPALARQLLQLGWIMSGTATSLPPLHTTVTQSYCVCGKFQFYALVCRKEPQKLDRRRLAGSSVSPGCAVAELIIRRE